MAASASRGCPLLAPFGRRGHRPVAHRAQVAAAVGFRLPLPPIPRTPIYGLSGGRARYLLLATETVAYKAVQRETQRVHTRYGTLSERRASVSFRAPRPPSHRSCGVGLVGPTPGRARGPLFIFRKIHLYGKTKKSTHGHTNPKPFCTHFFQIVHADRGGRGERGEIGLARPGRHWPEIRPVKVQL